MNVEENQSPEPHPNRSSSADPQTPLAEEQPDGTAAGLFGSALRGISDAAQTGKDAIGGVTKGGAEKVADAYRTTAGTMSDLGDGVASMYSRTSDSILSGIQGARNIAADTTALTVLLGGAGIGIAGEAALIGAAGFPYLLFGGELLEAGVSIGDTLGSALSQVVRGNDPQMMGVKMAKPGLFKTPVAHAILYDNSHESADASGFVHLSETQLTEQLVAHMAVDEKSKSSKVYMVAIAGVQAHKRQLRVNLDTPEILKEQ